MSHKGGPKVYNHCNSSSYSCCQHFEATDNEVSVPQIWWTGCFYTGRMQRHRCTSGSVCTDTVRRRLSSETAPQSTTCCVTASPPCVLSQPHTTTLRHTQSTTCCVAASPPCVLSQPHTTTLRHTRWTKLNIAFFCENTEALHLL